MSPLVSIIVPVYNVEKYLKRCVDSLVNQTYQNIEILLVDDGSKDSSGKMCDEFAEKYTQVRVVHKPNGGLSSARNAGMEVMHGEYALFVDSDDFIKLETVERCVECAVQQNADLVVFDMEYLYDDGQTVFSSGGEFSTGAFKDYPDLIRINNSACNKMVHRSLLDKFSFPVGMWYEDLASIPLLIVKAEKIAKVNLPLYVYYQRSNSIAHSADPRIFDVYRAVERVQKQVDVSIKSLYIVHGLDLTTLRIKDFQNRTMALDYLRQNMDIMNQYYPDWKRDPLLKTYPLKKRIIFELLDKNCFDLVLKCFKR